MSSKIPKVKVENELDLKSNNDVLILTNESKSFLRQRLIDVNNNVGASHKAVMKELKEWLNQKLST